MLRAPVCPLVRPECAFFNCLLSDLSNFSLAKLIQNKVKINGTIMLCREVILWKRESLATRICN